MDEGGIPAGTGGQLLTRPRHGGDATPDSTGAVTAVTDSVDTLPADTLHTLPGTPAADEPAITDSAMLATHLERVEAVPLSTQLGHDALARSLTADSLLREQSAIPTGGEADSLMAGAIASLAQQPAHADSIHTDSLASDTARTRIIKAYYNVRLFKSDLQAVADSVYYGYPDSMMRFFGLPMIWAQGSQMTADTLFMQVRNEQLDNMLLVGNAFMVNTQLDSSKYNQVKGRRITGFFTDNALDRMFVDGNAESIYYMVDEKAQQYTNMYHSRSSRIRIVVDSNEISEFSPIRRVDGKVYPMHLVPQEEEILDGFVWKPGDRPTSKEDLLNRRRPPANAEPAVPADSSATDGQPTGGGHPITRDSLEMEFPEETELPEQPQDSVEQQAPIVQDIVVRDSLMTDSIPLPDSVGRDSVAQKPATSARAASRAAAGTAMLPTASAALHTPPYASAAGLGKSAAPLYPPALPRTARATW